MTEGSFKIVGVDGSKVCSYNIRNPLPTKWDLKINSRQKRTELIKRSHELLTHMKHKFAKRSWVILEKSGVQAKDFFITARQQMLETDKADLQEEALVMKKARDEYED